MICGRQIVLRRQKHRSDEFHYLENLSRREEGRPQVGPASPLRLPATPSTNTLKTAHHNTAEACR
jgi:hypothetical protein